MIPLVVLGFLLAGTLLVASVAGGAALVAYRRLAADCDGAALAGAAAVDRAGLANPGRTGVLPLDRAAAEGVANDYLRSTAPAVTATSTTTPTTVTLVCRTTVRVPFGAAIARPHGISESATATAGTVIRPST